MFLQHLYKIIDLGYDFLRIVFDYSSNILDKIVKKMGTYGYFIYGIMANTLFFFSSITIRLLPQVDWTVSIMIRGMVTFIMSYLISKIYSKDLTFPGSELKYVTLRSGLMTVQQMFFYFVIGVIPLKITWVINNVGPIYVFVIGYFMMGTPLSRRDCLFLCVSLIGINIITAPQIIIQIASTFLPIDKEIIKSEMNSTQMIYSFIFFLSLGLWALAIVIVRLSLTASSLSINNSLGLHMIMGGALGFLSRCNSIKMPCFSDIILVIIFQAFPIFLSQILFIHGSIVATNPGLFTLTNYMAVIYSYIYQILFQNRNPSLFEMGGCFLTFYGLYKVVTRPDSEKTIQTNKDEEQDGILTRDPQISIRQQKSFHE